MKVLRFWGLLPAFCLLALPLSAGNTLRLSPGEAKVGNVLEMELTLSTTDEVQGLVAAFKWDGTKGAGVDFEKGAILQPSAADTVVVRVEDDYMVVGVVMDSDGVDDEIILPGDHLLGTARIRCAGAEADDVPVEFADGEFATVDGGPLLENIVVVGGLSIGRVEGLILENGSFDCYSLRDQFYIDPASGVGEAKVLMDAKQDVEGFVVALCNDPLELTLLSVEKGAAASAADFEAAEIFPDGGTLGVVMDLFDPYTNAVIPAGEGRHIATYRYRCAETGPGVAPPVRFCDLELGDPLKENVIVQGGLSVSPVLLDGEVSCEPACVPEGISYGNCDDGIDNDCDGRTDLEDPDCIPAEQLFLCGGAADDTGYPGAIDASLGTVTPVCFYLLNPEVTEVGNPGLGRDNIQGFSMAISFCCDIEVVEEDLDITGTILEAIGTEYVNVQADNDPADGDGCELIIGVLVDALPPFDGATIPPGDLPQLMGCVKFRVKDDAPCGPCCEISFTDGVNGRGKVPIRNLVSVENFSYSVVGIACEVCIVDQERFFRGDCNFSGDSSADGSLAVDVSDAAAVVSFLFLPGTWKFNPPCLDACDCNDDGRIDLADAVCILKYLFQQGAFPPDPGPGWRETGDPNPNSVEPTGAGVDPTPDMLDCKAGNRC